MPKGPNPKPSHLLQRRNKTPGAAELPTAEESAGNEVPELPARAAGLDGVLPPYHPMVVEWWDSIHRSPMASEWLESDRTGGLYLLADLHQARWEARDNAELLKAIAAEIRLQEVRFGLSPIDRSRLRWEVAKGDKAAEELAARRGALKPKPPADAKDPRDVLKMA